MEQMNLHAITKPINGLFAPLRERMTADFALQVLGAIGVFFVAWTLSRWVARVVDRGMKRARLDETLTRFATRLARWAVVIVGAVVCLKIFGVESTSGAALVASAGLALGLAFQGTLSNFAAGVMLLLFRPYQVGHVICVSGHRGKVDEIALFTTSIDTPDNRRIIIPNSQVFGAVIENASHHALRRVDVPVGVSYAADIDRTREVLVEAAQQVACRVDDPSADVVLGELGDSAVNWTVRIWVRAENFWEAKQELTRAIKVSLDRADIEIPFPQMDLHFRQAEQVVEKKEKIDDNRIRPRRRAA
jgi:small conductance mechanosensitive channel